MRIGGGMYRSGVWTTLDGVPAACGGRGVHSTLLLYRSSGCSLKETLAFFGSRTSTGASSSRSVAVERRMTVHECLIRRHAGSRPGATSWEIAMSRILTRPR